MSKLENSISSKEKAARRDWQGTIQFKLIAAFLVVTLVSLAVTSFLNVRNTSIALTENAQQNLRNAAEKTASDLDAFIKTNRDNIRTEAQIPVLVDYLSLPSFQRAGSVEVADVQSLLLALSRRDPVYISSYALMDRRGVDLVDTYAPDIGLDKSDRNYFQEPLSVGLPYVSPVEFSQTTGEAAIYFGAPVRNTAKEIIGVLRVRYNAAVLQEFISQASGLAGAESSAVLVDENNIRLADGVESSFIFTSIASLSDEQIAQLQDERRLPNLPADQLVLAVPALESGLNNFETQPFFDAELHTAEESTETVTVGQMTTQPWLVVFAQAQNVFLAPVEAQTRAVLLLSLVIAGAVAVAAYFIAQLFARPIIRLTNVASEISAGNWDAQAVVETADEIGTLASAFNKMTTQLRETLETLEQRVAERTRALATSTEVSRRLSTIFTQEELVSEVVNQVQSAFGYYHAHIYLAEGDELVMAGGTGEAGSEMLASGHKIPKGRGLVGHAAETNQAVLVSDTSQDPSWLPNKLLPDTKSEVAIPISTGDQVLGVLDVQHNVTDGLGQEDVDSLQSIANQVVVALQNARLFEQNEQQRRQNELILGSAAEGIFGLDLQGNHTFVNPAAAEMLGYSVEELIGKHSHSLWHHTYADGTPFPGDECPIYFTLRDDKANQGEEYFLRKDGAGIDVSFSSTPIHEEGRIVGAVVTFADITQQKREQEAIARNARQQEALNLISQRIQNAATIEEAMQVTARELGHALGKRQTFVALDPVALAGEQKKTEIVSD